MQPFDVQTTEIRVPRDTLFAFLKQPANLPKWAHAFESAGDGRARLRTERGAVDIRLRTEVNERAGTVDWCMLFPDDTEAWAHSRVLETTRGTCIYSFVLHAPPGPLEQIEGAMEQQRTTLARELLGLKRLLES